jgi:hypothetical protein
LNKVQVCFKFHPPFILKDWEKPQKVSVEKTLLYPRFERVPSGIDIRRFNTGILNEDSKNCKLDFLPLKVLILPLFDGRWPGQHSWYTYSLLAGRLRVWNPVGARKFIFCTPVQTNLGAHSTSCAMNTRALSGQQSRHGVALTTHTCRAEDKNDHNNTSTPLTAFIAWYRGNFISIWCYVYCISYFVFGYTER